MSVSCLKEMRKNVELICLRFHVLILTPFEESLFIWGVFSTETYLWTSSKLVVNYYSQEVQ